MASIPEVCNQPLIHRDETGDVVTGQCPFLSLVAATTLKDYYTFTINNSLATQQTDISPDLIGLCLNDKLYGVDQIDTLICYKYAILANFKCKPKK